MFHLKKPAQLQLSTEERPWPETRTHIHQSDSCLSTLNLLNPNKRCSAGSGWLLEFVQNLMLSLSLFFFFFTVLGFELRAYTLSQSTSPFLWWVFSRESLVNYLNYLLSASWVGRITDVESPALDCPDLLSAYTFPSVLLRRARPYISALSFAKFVSPALGTCSPSNS
jgi:hypothetical protein